MNCCECTCWTWIWSCSQPIILFTATALPLSLLTTSFPLLPSACVIPCKCEVVVLWHWNWGYFYTHLDHVTTRCLCDVTAVWSDGDTKVSDILQIDTLWWIFEGRWVSKLGLKKTLQYSPCFRFYYTEYLVSFEPLGRVMKMVCVRRMRTY
jgi:hypothetical protein